MNHVKKWLLVLLVIVPWSGVSVAIEVCGPVTGVWSLADSPVTVVCDLNVADLTIEQGVEVQVTGDYEIVVSGILRALGSQASPIVFQPSPENSVGWGGFYFEDSIDGSAFQWTRIEGATSSAVHLVRSTPSFDHVTFKDNRAAAYGGAIHAELLSNDLPVNNSLFLNNFAGTAGGAIYVVGPTGVGEAALVVADSVFRENHAGTTNATQHNTAGGAIYVNGHSRITGSTFRDNEARAYTIYAAGGRYTQGGAIYTAGGRSEILASSFMSNACRMGAHVYTPDASRAYGGAVNIGSGELLLSNSLVAENELVVSRNADYRGAGVYVGGGVASIVNTTLVNNNRHALYQVGGDVTVLNSLVFFNNASGVQMAGTVTATYSAIQNGYAGEGNISVNPIFNALYGIVTPSPAIDAGNPAPAYNDLLPPGQGGVINDMGYTGGPNAIFSALPNAGPNRNVNEREPVTLDATASADLDGDPFGYLWRQISGPPVDLSDTTVGQPTFLAPEVTDATVLTFELFLTAGAAVSAPDIVQITINHVNQVPLADAGVDQTVDERTSVSLDGRGSSDPDGDVITYVWRQVAGPSVALSDTTDVEPTFIAPDIQQATALVFELVVNDGTADSVADSVEILVNHVNRAPMAQAGQDQEVDERILVTLDGQGSSDPDADAITYLWQQVSGPTVVLSDVTAVQPTFEAPDVSVATPLVFELVVNDGEIDSAIDSVQITVNHVNQIPIADAGPDQVVDGQTTVSLNGSASYDPDGASISYRWRQVSGSPVTLSNETTAESTFVAPIVQVTTTLIFELVVNDGEADSIADQVNIRVNHERLAPIANAGVDLVVDERTTVMLDGSESSDPNGDVITYSWRQVSGPAVTLSSHTIAQPTFVAPEVTGAETILFELMVDDGDGGSAVDQIQITVNHVNRAPIANAGPDRSVYAGSLVLLDGSGSTDPDDDKISYSWRQVSGPDVTLSGDTLAQPTFVAPEVTDTAIIVFELIVSDVATDTSNDRVTITVSQLPPPTPPPPPFEGTRPPPGGGGGDSGGGAFSHWLLLLLGGYLMIFRIRRPNAERFRNTSAIH